MTIYYRSINFDFNLVTFEFFQVQKKKPLKRNQPNGNYDPTTTLLLTPTHSEKEA